MTQCGEGSVEDIIPHTKEAALTADLPEFLFRSKFFQNLYGIKFKPLRFYLIGEVIEYDIGADAAFVLVFTQKEIEKGGLAFSVPAQKAAAPVAVDGKAYVF